MTKIQYIARQAAENAVLNNCNLRDVPFHAEIADMVAASVLCTVKAEELNVLVNGGPYTVGRQERVIFSEAVDRMLAQFQPSAETQTNVVNVPDVPGPMGVCWQSAPTMDQGRCTFSAGHVGPHQWATRWPK